MNFSPRNPKFKERVIQKFKLNSLSHHIGISLTDISAGEVWAKVPISQEVSQQDNIAHGGLTLTLADVVAGFAAYSLVEENQRVVTAELKNSFFKPGKGDYLIGKGTVVKAGRQMMFCESEIFAETNGERTLIAKSTSIMAVIQ